MVHASGVIYEGLWINGRPEGNIGGVFWICLLIILVETTRLLAEMNTKRSSQIMIEQGKPFSIVVKCIDDNGEIITIG